MDITEDIKRGGGEDAIKHHYDVSNEFYSLWLDKTMSYSSAMWDGKRNSDLHSAQQQKIRWHIEQATTSDTKNLLDIGCGWGAVMQEFVSQKKGRCATGLTLSNDQKNFISAQKQSNINVEYSHWVEHMPTAAYDAIISIGAFEHFALPGSSRAEKVASYQEFFQYCHKNLKPGSKLSLQTIAYGSLKEENKNLFTQNEIFPDSELPRADEILQASEHLFELHTLRNDRLDYAKTCDLWLSDLRKNKGKVIALHGQDTFKKYEEYLKLAIFGFYSGQINLLRLVYSAI